jgi:hypothetical protein
MALVQSPAHSWDGAVVGTIASLDVTGGSNYGLRIGLNDISSMCNGGENWAFLNDTDSNYKAYVAALLLAKAQGSRVAVYTMLEGSYCHIGYISILAVVSQ